MLTGLQQRLFFGGALIALQFVIYDFCRVRAPSFECFEVLLSTVGCRGGRIHE